MEGLSKQDQEFVREVAITGNQTQAAKKAYGITDNNYAGVKGLKAIRKDKIAIAVEEVKKSIADQIPDDLLVKVHLEGLNATSGSGDNTQVDYGIRHKYLDTALKIKGMYDGDDQSKGKIFIPVLVKFLDKKYDTDSDGDTNRIP